MFPCLVLMVLCLLFTPSFSNPPYSNKRFIKFLDFSDESSTPGEKPASSAVAKAKSPQKNPSKTAMTEPLPKEAKAECIMEDGRQSKRVSSSLRGLEPDRPPYYGGGTYDDRPDYPVTSEYIIDQDPQQYIISAETVAGERLYGGLDLGTKKTLYAGTQEPIHYNLPEATELWMFEPYLADGKIVYQIKNVQHGLYLKASPEIEENFYHLCILTKEGDDIAMYWEIDPAHSRKIRNVYYDEYLIASGNRTGLAMTHPRPSQEEDTTWVLTKKKDFLRMKYLRPKYHG